MRTTAPRVEKYKHSKTSPFVVEGLRIAGKRVRKFFASERDAKTWLRQHLARAEQEGVGGVLMSDELRIEACTLAKRLEPYGKTLTQAVDHFLAHLAAVERTCTVAELSAEFQAAKGKDGAKPNYLKDLKYRLAAFTADFGPRKVAEIQKHELAAWLRDLDASAQSKKNHHTVLRTMFNFAVESAYAPVNFLTGIAPAKIRRGPPPILTPAQLRAILEKTDPAYLPYLTIGAFAGLRMSELENLDWSEIDLAERLILVNSEGKTGRRYVKVSDNLAAWLAPLAQKQGLVISPRSARTARRNACTYAELAEWPDNGLRHSFASYHVAHHKNTANTAHEMGNSEKMVKAHYENLVKPAEGAAWWQIVPPADFGNVVAFSEEVANA